MKNLKKVAVGMVLSMTLLNACGDGKSKKAEGQKLSKKEAVASIKTMEDSLKKMQASKITIENIHRIELANRYLAYYQNFSNEKYAATCLDKVQMIYSGMGVHKLSIQYSDTLLQKYPKYENRALILESQGANYDIFASPRDSAKVRYYYNLLIQENPSMSQDKKDGILERLANNHLSFDDYINKKIKETIKK